MIHLRPQRVYKPSALSYLGDPSDIVDSIIDRYLNKDLYRLRIETPRGTSITADNSQITCYAHIFDKGDGTELTDLLKGRGFHPTWLLDGKPIDSARISEEGYQLTLETDHLPAIYQAVTLQVRDTDILLALTTDENQKRVYSQLIELGSIPTHLIKTSEKLLNVSRLDKIRVEGLEEIRQDLSQGISANSAALEELHKNPLTISKEGYWRIWDIKQHQYVTTEYQSRGDKGEPGDKGDKGDKPKLTLDSQLRLLADGELLSQQSLKGDKPSPEEILDTSHFKELLGAEVTTQVAPVSQSIEDVKTTAYTKIENSSHYAIDLINETQSQICDMQVLGMSDGGVIEVKRQAACCRYDYPNEDGGYTWTAKPKPKYVRAQIPLTLRSSHEALGRDVSSLEMQLANCKRDLSNTKQALNKLEADTKITPVTNTNLRAGRNSRGQYTNTLSPRYGDWLLTSDSADQYITFAGLSAEVGRSIYIQTRRKAYLYANNHSFFGLPGSSTSVSQWLSNNTTYRFVRASSTSWFVTSSPSPYPWT